MIKIDKNAFDINKINDIYQTLATRVQSKFNKYIKSSTSDKEIIQKFKELFNCNEEQNMQKNIQEFLMSENINDINKAIKLFNNSNSSRLGIIIKKFFSLSSSSYVKNLFGNLKQQELDYIDEIKVLEDKLKEFLTDTKNINKKFNQDVKNKCFEILDNDDMLESIMKELKWNKEIEEVINYNILKPNERHKLISAMNVKVCPYCNRQYITNWVDHSSNTHVTADLDHFYPKSLYPIASLCLYNFIPSCQICNSRFKLATDFFEVSHIYPYEFEFGNNAKFEIDNIEALMGYSPEFSVHQKTEIHSEEIKNSLNTFHINEVYKSHTNYVKELIQKIEIYNKTNIEEYLRNYGDMFKDKNEIFTFIFGDILDRNQFTERPLSKLTCDIMDDLKRII